MSREGGRTSERGAAKPVPATPYEQVLFFALLALLSVRPLILETFERTELAFLPAGSGTTPAATVWLDALTLTAASAVLARRWGRRRGDTWALAGTVVLALAVGVSAALAHEKRAALNAGFSLVIGVLAGLALAALMRARWMPRLLLAATLAGGVATATKCVAWKAYEWDNTREFWQEYKAGLAAAGEDLDDPMIVNFERRLQSGEAVGYQAHPNVTGSYLMMWLLTAAGLLAGWWAGRGRLARGEWAAAVTLCAAVVLLLAVGLWFTGSTGAQAALVGGLALLIVLGRGRRRIARMPGMTTACLGTACLVLMVGVGVYGVSRGTLPHPSLAFRWHYWTAAARVVQDHPLTGIGRLNFGEAYLRYKPVESTEEVQNPHNIWLALLVELGPLGLLAGVVLAGGAVRSALRRLDGRPGARDETERVPGWRLVAAGTAVLVLHAVFSGRIESGATALLWAVEVAAVWGLAFVLAVRVLETLPDLDAVRGWVQAGLAAALLGALLHGLISFALLTIGGLCVFVSLAACAAFPPEAPSPVTATPARRAAALAGALLVSLHLVTVTWPTMRTQFRLDQVRGSLWRGGAVLPPDVLLVRLREAADCDPLDAAAARQAAGLGLMLVRGADVSQERRLALLEQVRALAERAVERNPHAKAGHVLLARTWQEIEETALLALRPERAVQALEHAAREWEEAVRLYPTNPRTRISAGQAWLNWWQESGDPEAARRAGEHFAAALRIDATRKPGEVVRLRESELETIRQGLRELEAAGFGPATAPAGEGNAPRPGITP